MFNIPKELSVLLDTAVKRSVADKLFKEAALKYGVNGRLSTIAFNASNSAYRAWYSARERFVSRYRTNIAPADLLLFCSLLLFLPTSDPYITTPIEWLFDMIVAEWPSVYAEDFELQEALASVGWALHEYSNHTYQMGKQFIAARRTFFRQDVLVGCIIHWSTPQEDLFYRGANLHTIERLAAFKIPIQNMDEYWKIIAFVVNNCPQLKTLTLTFCDL